MLLAVTGNYGIMKKKVKKRKENESMLPDRVSNPGPLTYESGALPIALRGPAFKGQ